MNYQELEEFLYKKAMEDVPQRDFEDVWEHIKDKMWRKPEHDWKVFWKKTLVAVAVAAILLCPYVAIPFLSPSPQIYLSDNLECREVEQAVFENQLQNATFEVVDFSKYESDGYVLFVTDTGEVKGGQVNVVEPNGAWFLFMRFYEETVQLNEEIVEYDQTCTVGAATVEYRLKDYVAEYGMYVYDMKANYRSVNYLMEYTCMIDDLTPFLQSFFSETVRG